MSNRSTVTEFLLLGFSDVQELQVLHFVLFLVLYLAALMGNLLISTVVALDHHPHTPMYFFLGKLSILDLGSISVTIPKSMANAFLNSRVISYAGCVTQIFLYFICAATDVFLLTVMAYDRYVAICHPLHYEQVMNRRACVHMAASTWLAGILYSAIHTAKTFRLPFCQDNNIHQFFCEISQLLRLASSDLHLSEVTLLISGVFLAVSCFVFIVVSYVQIFKVVLRIPSEQGDKAFSTCLPHLAVVSLFMSTSFVEYLKPTSSSASKLNILVAVLYAVVPPTMNPVINSMRSKEIRAALKKLIIWRIFTKN